MYLRATEGLSANTRLFFGVEQETRAEKSESAYNLKVTCVVFISVLRKRRSSDRLKRFIRYLRQFIRYVNFSFSIETDIRFISMEPLLVSVRGVMCTVFRSSRWSMLVVRAGIMPGTRCVTVLSAR